MKLHEEAVFSRDELIASLVKCATENFGFQGAVGADVNHTLDADGNLESVELIGCTELVSSEE